MRRAIIFLTAWITPAFGTYCFRQCGQTTSDSRQHFSFSRFPITASPPSSRLPPRTPRPDDQFRQSPRRRPRFGLNVAVHGAEDVLLLALNADRAEPNVLIQLHAAGDTIAAVPVAIEVRG